MIDDDIKYIQTFAGPTPPAPQFIANTLHAQMVQLEEMLGTDLEGITLREFMTATASWLEGIVQRIDEVTDNG